MATINIRMAMLCRTFVYHFALRVSTLKLFLLLIYKPQDQACDKICSIPCQQCCWHTSYTSIFWLLSVIIDSSKENIVNAHALDGESLKINMISTIVHFLTVSSIQQQLLLTQCVMIITNECVHGSSLRMWPFTTRGRNYLLLVTIISIGYSCTCGTVIYWNHSTVIQ